MSVGQNILVVWDMEMGLRSTGAMGRGMKNEFWGNILGLDHIWYLNLDHLCTIESQWS